MAEAPLTFHKMNGAGNEILVLDLRAKPIVLEAEEVREIAATPGLGFDQLMSILPPGGNGVDAELRIYNRDGSVSAACGNGTRCVAALFFAETDTREIRFLTEAGILPARRGGDGAITVDMGEPRFRWDEIPLAEPFHDLRAIELQIGPIDNPFLHSPTVISMGNPHAIFWVDNVDTFSLDQLGPLIENHPVFPERANVTLAEVRAPDRIKLRVWERGAGLTKACGSAACAAAVAGAWTKRTERKVVTSLPGGELHIEWRESDGHVLMTGPWELEQSGTLEIAAEPAS